MWLNHTTKTANMKKALLLVSTLTKRRCLIAVVLVDVDLPYWTSNVEHVVAFPACAVQHLHCTCAETVIYALQV